MKVHTLYTKSFLLPLFFLLLTSLISHSKACNVIDKEALLQFKNKITSDPSQLLNSWTLSTDCCKGWNGVTCDSTTGRVVSLTLSGTVDDGIDLPFDTYLSGTLSPYLGNLTNLKILSQTSCNIERRTRKPPDE
ncbi:LRR amino-terminal domain protein [Medicago truncatula]|uniref:LRR amino-terminal domain protein n=2 Tax=Medicago truncatula TaxID=3880 RepID=G7LD17_MEDTR|nr:LRR amino-terminal domain protein [Medicago truncatula]